jgi:Subtilase family
MTVYFTEMDGEYGRPDDEQTDQQYLPPIPRAVLDRHGAQVLDPATMVVDTGEESPQPTIYRSARLLMPDSAMARLGELNQVLGEIGLEIIRPRGEGRGELPRPAALAVRSDWKGPATLDAAVALRCLRVSPPPETEPPGYEPSDSTADSASDWDSVVRSISMEHLLFGMDSYLGTPGSYGPSGLSVTTSGGGGWDVGRIPVVWSGTVPDRGRYQGRRPVVAVLDSGIAEHEWLDVAYPSGTKPGGFIAVDQAIQHAIRENREGVGSSGASYAERQVIDDEWDKPVVSETLADRVDTHIGHGTFIAGLVRQIAPEAQVLAIRVMHGDGVVYEGDLLIALTMILERVRAAHRGDPEKMVDVVSLSLGHYPTHMHDDPVTRVIDQLLDEGVMVCAAAGNDSTTRPFLPAALAARPPSNAGQQVISVGALNPNHTKALFSNDSYSWVRCWAPGAALVSTFPRQVQGIATATFGRPAWAPPHLPRRRETQDLDDFSSGFAIWSGTSFAAPQVAAAVAAVMIERCRGHQEMPDLAKVDQASARARVVAAIKAVKNAERG